MTVPPHQRRRAPPPPPLQPTPQPQSPSQLPPRSQKRSLPTTPTPLASNPSLATPCGDIERPLKKLKRSSVFNTKSSIEMDDSEPELYAAAIPADTAESVRKDVAPFLSKHIPGQYAPQGPQQQHNKEQNIEQKGNTKFCYRHRPDIKCRRQADESTMEELQKGMETLPAADQQAITDVWSLFSAAPATHRNLMLRGILTQCCFPQLSMISAALRELIRIDFLSALPPEISFKILCYLDTASLCKAAQISHRWRMLADDDVVWHKMCEQHIDRKCDKCGWGLPLLERKRLRMTKRQMERRAKEPNIFTTEITTGTSNLNIHGKRPNDRTSPDTEMTPAAPAKRSCQRAVEVPPTRPWKDVYSERFKVESNWRRGRCTKKIFKGHSDGIMCLQFDDAILATGSYDSTVKIWDIETGKEIRTLAGHDSGVRALMFDERKLISGSLDKTLKIWDWRTGKCLSTLPGHTGGVVCLHFNENLLASGSVDTTIKIWNFVDKSCYTLKGHTDWVNSVRIDSDSRMIFSASDDQTVRMWDLDTKACVQVFEGHVGHVQQVIPMQLPGYMSPKSPRPDAIQKTIPPSHQHPQHPWQEYRDKKSPSPKTRPRAPPPERMITAALDSTVKFWDVATGKCTKTLFGHVEGVWALAADSLRVISGAQDRMVKVWDVRTGRCQRTITGHQGPVTCVGLSDSGVVTGSEDGEARMYCFKSEGDCVHGWSTPPDFVGSSDTGGSISSEE